MTSRRERWTRVPLALCLALLSSCFGLTKTRYSKPSVQDPSVVTRNEPGIGPMFVLRDVRFTVFPNNSRGSDVLLFPIPAPTGPHAVPGEKLVVSFALRSDGGPLKLDAQQIEYRNGQSVARPQWVQTPRKCNSTKRPVTQRLSLPAEPLQLEKGQCGVFVAGFDVPNPTPGESFTLQIGGVSVNGQEMGLPPITFQPAKKIDTFAVP